MNDVIEQAIIILTSAGSEATKSDDALKFTQAALNLAHTLVTLDSLNR